MNKADFERLKLSVRQAGQIRRGTLKPARVTTIEPADVKNIRSRLDQSWYTTRWIERAIVGSAWSG